MTMNTTTDAWVQLADEARPYKEGVRLYNVQSPDEVIAQMRKNNGASAGLDRLLAAIERAHDDQYAALVSEIRVQTGRTVAGEMRTPTPLLKPGKESLAAAGFQFAGSR
jgi:hypothetical protein